jgi:hypothetical protein
MPHPRDRELARLVETRASESVLSIAPLEVIADTWCNYFAVDHEPTADYTPDWWAVEFFYSCVGPELQQDALLALVARARGNHRLLSVIGAGPFEDYIDEFDVAQVEWLERNAASSESFREALAGMRLSRDLSDELRARINRARGFPPNRWLKSIRRRRRRTAALGAVSNFVIRQPKLRGSIMRATLVVNSAESSHRHPSTIDAYAICRVANCRYVPAAGTLQSRQASLSYDPTITRHSRQASVSTSRPWSPTSGVGE